MAGNRHPFISGLAGVALTLALLAPCARAAVGGAASAPADDRGSRVEAPIGKSPVRGPTTAAVTIVEFADYSCYYCRQAETVLRQLVQKYPKDLRLVFKNLPLVDIHPDAQAQAIGADCAQAQGKFWEYHDALMPSSAPARSLPRLIKSIGGNVARWQACVKKGGSGLVASDVALATRLGVDGTPAFVINGLLFSGFLSFEQMASLVETERRAAAR